MKLSNWIVHLGLVVVLFREDSGVAAVARSEWLQTQSFTVASPGLVKASLPAETLGALRPDGVDLRVVDRDGGEVGWFLERPLRTTPDSPVQRPKSFRPTIQGTSMTLLLETGIRFPVVGLDFEAGTGSFLKSVRIDASEDGQTWELLADGVPLYQKYQGETQLHISLAPHAWGWLRVGVDNSRTDPVAFTGVRLQVDPSGGRATVERRALSILSREELSGESRLTLDLGSGNLDVGGLRIFADDGIFTRGTSLRLRALERDRWVERVISRGLIHRSGVADGRAQQVSVGLEIGESIPGREAILVIQNGDNPPLSIRSIEAELLPVQLVFWARQPGRYELLVGNPVCPAPRYDLQALAEQIRNVPTVSGEFGVLTANLAYRAPAVMPDPYVLGAAVDASQWRFRKSLPITRNGAQVVELDLAVAAGSNRDFSDVRLISDGRQRPFIREASAGSRNTPVDAIPMADAKHPSVSRWKIRLPYARVPVRSLTLETASRLFEREVVVYEKINDPRGENPRRVLGQARWHQEPGGVMHPITIALSSQPETEEFYIEIQNGDNAAIALGAVSYSYSTTRLHFLAPTSPATWLYYGNTRASVPEYDLNLVAGRLLAARAETVQPGEVESLGQSRVTGWMVSGGMEWAFWVGLTVVVAVLLLVLRRLVPASPGVG